MKLVELNRDPTDRQLKQFGATSFVFLVFVGWVVAGRPSTFAAANWPLIGGFAAAGLCLAVLALVRPTAVKWLFVGLSAVAFPIGLVISEIVLLVTYLCVFVPVGLVFRLIGRDALQLKFDRKGKSYWQAKRQPDGARSYYRQF